jgi:hypothetical protein
MRRIVALLLVLLTVLRVSAQEASPTPPPFGGASATPLQTSTPTLTPTALPTFAATYEGIATYAFVEVVFPAAVRFTMYVIRPIDEIALMTITLTREDGSVVEVVLDPEEARRDERTFPDYDYNWLLTATNAPRLFEQIEYRWAVTTVDGEVGSAQGSFQFTDQRVLWEQRTDEGRRIDLALRRGFNANRLGQSLDVIYDALSANTGQRPQASLLLYDNAFPPPACVENDDGEWVAIAQSDGAEFPCAEPQLAQVIIAESGYEVLQSRAYTIPDIQDVVTPYLFQRFYAPLWEGRGVPEWFAYGLMSLYALTPNADLYGAALAAARGGALLPLSQMAVVDDSDPDLWQAQAYGMVLYMANEIGLPGLFALARSLEIEAFADAYRASMGAPLSGLIPVLRDWLFTPAAEAAFRVSIYAQATLTPSPTLTFTPFPPTRTPRPLPSVTPTPTITLTRTPRPSATPTPSLTPRPPRSLDTPVPPTAIPTQTTQPLIETGSRTSILAVLLIVLAVLVILYSRTGRR